MDRIDFLGFVLLLRDISRSDRYSTEQSDLVSGKTIACVGAFTGRKGQDVLVDAVGLLDDRMDLSNVSVILVGDGPTKSKVRKRIQEQDLNQTFTIESNLTREALNLLFRDCYVFALPSWNEPCAVVYSEVMPYGTPVVATEGEGFSELLIDRENGCLVGREDTENLAESLEFLLTNESEARGIGEQGKELVETNLTWEHNAKALLRTFS